MKASMKKAVYLETTIPSFYYESRLEPEMVARKHWTQAWWHHCSDNFDLRTSDAVIIELSEGSFPHQKEALEFLKEVSLLPISQEIFEIVQSYIQNHVMPSDPMGDALHLAIASYHKCDFLLTWNCRHLANANKLGHIKRVNSILGLFTPQLITPLELLGDEEKM